MTYFQWVFSSNAITQTNLQQTVYDSLKASCFKKSALPMYWKGKTHYAEVHILCQYSEKTQPLSQ